MAKDKKKNVSEKKTEENVEEVQVKENIDHSELEEKLKEAENQILLSLADNDNLRKRFDREKEDLSNYVISSFAKEILSVLDNLERALKSIDLDELKKSDQNISQFVEGIELTEKQIITVFEKFKIEKINSLDQNFDPNLHQAMFEVENPDKQPGIITEVVQEGYRIGDRLLRPAMVGVVKKKN
ncbi:MAG: nucleotide exchange factor GrpE [Candidatus Pelagibacterales bacterium]|jgi:molecular chaperone GrpE|tara:strand:+ start:462 stop:1013 length:552 start_codon:yes stop_codon:yes gene_type:complete